MFSAATVCGCHSVTALQILRKIVPMVCRAAVLRQPQFLWMYFLRIHQLFARFHCTWLNIRFIISVFIIHNSLLDVAKLLFLHLQIIMLKI